MWRWWGNTKGTAPRSPLCSPRCKGSICVPSSTAVQGLQAVTRNKVTGSPGRKEQSSCSVEQAQSRREEMPLPQIRCQGRLRSGIHTMDGQVSPKDSTAHIIKSKFFSLRLTCWCQTPYLIISFCPQPLVVLQAHCLLSSLHSLACGDGLSLFWMVSSANLSSPLSSLPRTTRVPTE